MNNDATLARPRLFYGWLVVAAAFAVTFVGFGCAYTFSAFVESLQQDFGAGARDHVGRSAMPRSQRQRQEAHQPSHRAIGEIRVDFVEPGCDGGKAGLHRAIHQRDVGLLPSFVLPRANAGLR